MVKYLIKGLLAGIAAKLLGSCRSLSVQLLKIEAAKCYLHGVEIARLSAISFMRTGLQIGLVCVGALLLHAGLLVLLPWSVEAKALLCVCLGAAYVLIGCIGLRAAIDEKAWMKASGAAEMVEKAIGQSKRN